MAVLPKFDLYARAVSDRDEIVAYLRTDRIYAAYTLGDLDGPNRHRCNWGIAYDDLGRPIALVMHQEGLIPQPTFLMGDPAGCREILDTVIRPRDAYFMGTEAIDAALDDLYDLDPPQYLLRMAVNEMSFQPFAGPADRLTAEQVYGFTCRRAKASATSTWRMVSSMTSEPWPASNR